MKDPSNLDHLTTEDFYYFIDGGLEGHSSGRVESHLAVCSECLETLDMIVHGQSPWTAEEQESAREPLFVSLAALASVVRLDSLT